MHKCVNQSDGDLSHLEQMISNFFPYSLKQLGFNKPITIIFQSDTDNASKMLGKTAFYDPARMEVVLYTDNRHPKDVMRSLSHELVHHAQNCRGEFGQGSTEPGYAQKDPHMRKMEREAYTKGNLIFRDFEDLIKTGKINIEIDFSDSGEPKMSLKEWKNNELNMLLMKKWGLGKNKTRLNEGILDTAIDNQKQVSSMVTDNPALGGALGFRDDEEDPQEDHPDVRAAIAQGEHPAVARLAHRRGQLHTGKVDPEAYAEKSPFDYTPEKEEEEAAISAVKGGKGLEENDEIEERFSFSSRRQIEKDQEAADIAALDPSSPQNVSFAEDPAAHMSPGSAEKLGLSPQDVRDAVDWGGAPEPTRKAQKKWRDAFAGQFKQGKGAGDEQEVRGGRPVPRAAGSTKRRDPASSRHLGSMTTWGENRKISVREAKEITRRIIERVRKEGK